MAVVATDSVASVHGNAPSALAARSALIRVRNSRTCAARTGVTPVVSVESVTECASVNMTATVAAFESALPKLFDTLTQYLARPLSGGVVKAGELVPTGLVVVPAEPAYHW